LEYRLYLIPFQVLYGGALSPLERDSQNTLTVIEYQRIVPGQVPKESVQASQADVSGLTAVFPLLFQMIEEIYHHGRSQIGYGQVGDGFFLTLGAESQKQLDGISIA
jgi:hypothetical protein